MFKNYDRRVIAFGFEFIFSRYNSSPPGRGACMTWRNILNTIIAAEAGEEIDNI